MSTYSPHLSSTTLRLAALVLLLLPLVSIGCGGQAPRAEPAEAPTPVASQAVDEGPVSGGTLVIVRAADTVAFDPADVIEGESTKVNHQIFEGLVRFADGSTDIEPGLATSWESSDDGLVWTFHLRQGVTFHDGTTFDADAVVFSIARQMDPEHPFHNGEFNTWHNTFAGHIRTVEALDPLTVRISLNRPFAPILSGFAANTMAIISPTAMRENGKEWFDSHGVGTGPFRFVDWERGERIVLEANPDYWGGRPYLDRVVFRVVPESADRGALLESGEANVAEGLDSATLTRLKGNAELKIRKEPGLNTGYFAMNTTREPFTDLRVRRAVSLGVDMSGLVRATYHEFGVPAKNYLPPVLWGFYDEVAPYRYDPEQARQLLEEAGYPDGFSLTLDVMKNARPYMPEPLKIANGIREQLGRIGIEVEIRANEWPEQIRRIIRSPDGDYDACLLGWMADMPDPNDFLYVMFASSNADLSRAHQNIPLYRNDEVDRLVEAAQRTSDREQRSELYRQVQAIVREDVPLIPIAHSFLVLVQSKSVKGISVPVTSGNYGLAKTWIEEAASAQ